MGKQQEAPLQSSLETISLLLSLPALLLLYSSSSALVPLGVQSGRKGAPPGPQQQQQQHTGAAGVMQGVVRCCSSQKKCIQCIHFASPSCPSSLSIRPSAAAQLLSASGARMLNLPAARSMCRTSGVRSTPNAQCLVRTTPTAAAAMNYVPRG